MFVGITAQHCRPLLVNKWIPSLDITKTGHLLSENHYETKAGLAWGFLKVLLHLCPKWGQPSPPTEGCPGSGEAPAPPEDSWVPFSPTAGILSSDTALATWLKVRHHIKPLHVRQVQNVTWTHHLPAEYKQDSQTLKSSTKTLPEAQACFREVTSFIPWYSSCKSVWLKHLPHNKLLSED